MRITVGDLLLLQDDSFGNVEIHDRKTKEEIFCGSSEDAIKFYSDYEVLSFGTNFYENLCIDIETV